jgi:hypothetical protein
MDPVHATLEWSRCTRFSYARVLAWTCAEHRVTSYELCSAAGLAFLRRTVAAKGWSTPIVAYSDAWPINEGRAMWAELVAGRLI